MITPPRLRLPAGLLLAAALIRLPGLLADRPLGSPDESSWIYGVLEPMLGGQANPHYFEYPAGAVFTLCWVLGRLAYAAGHVLGVYPDFESFRSALHADLWGFAVLFRVPTFLCGLAGVATVHALAARLAPAWVARAAALAVTLATPFAATTRMHTVDVAAAALACAALALSLDGLDEEEPPARRLALIGALLGTLVNLKIPYVLAAVMLPAASLLSRRAPRVASASVGLPLVMLAGGLVVLKILYPWQLPEDVIARFPLGARAMLFLRKNLALLGFLSAATGAVSLVLPRVRAWILGLLTDRRVVIPAVAAAAAFFAWSPFYLADMQKTLFDIMIVARPVDPEAYTHPPPTFHAVILRRSSTELVGPVIGVLGWLGMAAALARRDRRDLLVLSVPGVWFAYTGLASYSKLNLMHLFVPFLALYAARALWWLCGARPRVAWVALALALIPPALEVGQGWRDAVTHPPLDTRLELRAWYRARFPGGQAVAQDPNLMLRDAANDTAYHVPVARRGLAEVRAAGLRWVITNSEARSWFHLTDEQMDALARDLRASAHLAARFEPGPGVAGPGIEVYELR